MKLTYTKQGDYLIPDITIRQPRKALGHYGRLRKTYLQNFRPILFNELVLSDICLFAFAHRRTGNSVGYEPKRDNNTADFLMDFPTSWTCATAGLPCNNDFITFATKPYIRYFLKEL